MSKKIIKILVLLLLLPSLSYSKEQSENNKKKNETHFEEGRVKQTDKSVKIPKQLTKIIEDDYISEFKKFDPVRASVVSRLDIISKSDKKYFDVKVYLNDHKNGSLNTPVKFNMSRGGGIIDLSDYVTKRKTSFNVKFLINAPGVEDFSNNNGNLKVFFFSNAKKKKVKKEVYGSGCNSFMDVTSFYKGKLSQKGVEVSVDNLHYLSLLAGTFYLYFPNNDEFYLGSLTFTDSRYPKLLCR